MIMPQMTPRPDNAALEPLQLSGSSIPRINRHFRLQWEEAQQAYVLLYPEGMVTLNGSAGEIMACCDGAMNVAGMIDLLEQRFPEAGALGDDIREFLGEAYAQRWIQFD